MASLLSTIMLTLTLSDVRVVESGPENAPALVLLHGAGSSLETWDGWADELSDQYRVIRMDLPGSGYTPRPEPDDPRIDADLAVVNRVLRERNVGRYSVAGSSRGGFLAWLLAARSNEVDKLILIDSIGLTATPGPAERLPKIARVVVRHWLPRWMVALAMRHAFGETPPSDAVIDRYWNHALRDDNRGAVDERTTPGNWVNHVDELANIHVPTLILWGREDHGLDAGDPCRFHNAINDSTLVVLPKLGHLPMEADPKTTAALAREFLEDRPLTLPAGARTDCQRMRPTPRFVRGRSKHCEGDMTADELRTRRKNTFDFNGIEVFVTGNGGPPILLLHEVPGLTRNTFILADDIAAAGYTVYLPALFGDPGVRRANLNAVRAALGPSFFAIRPGHTPRIANRIVALARRIHERHPDESMGVIGMCLTGSLPIPTLQLDFVDAIVLAQPSIPFFFPRDLGLSKRDIEAAKNSGVPIRALRFSHDNISPWERQEAFEKTFGTQIRFTTIDSSPGNRGGAPTTAHATLTYERIAANDGNGVVQKAFEEIVAYLNDQLKTRGRSK